MDIYKFLLEDYKKEMEMKSDTARFWEDVAKTVMECYNMQVVEIPNPEITEVVFFGKTECRVVWSDGVVTKLTCEKKDVFSEETAILMAVCKRFMKGYTTVQKALEIAERLPSKGRLNKLMDK